MSQNTKTYDAIIIPTGEPRVANPKKGEEDFPVARKAIEEYKKGLYDCIFVTGGYGGFVNKIDGPLYRKRSEFGKYADFLEKKGLLEEKKEGEIKLFRKKSDAEETADFIKGMGIPEEKVYFDGRSYEGIGKFTFPLVQPIININPGFQEFDSMLIFGEQGKMWKTRNYANLVLRDVSKLDFFTVPSKQNIPFDDIVYYASIMRALHDYGNPKDIHAFLLQEHPFYSEKWFKKSKIRRGLEIGLKGLDWWRPSELK
jgi:hypothetical protein